MPRIPPVTDPAPEVAEELAKTVVGGSRPANIFTTLAHHPRLLRRFNVLGGLFLGRGLLPPRDRELVILRVGWRCQAVYEFGQHTRLGQAAGLTREEVAMICADPLDGWPGPDGDLLRAADELVVDHTVGDATWRRLSDRFDQAELLELVTLAGFYVMVSGLVNSVEIELDEGIPGWPDSRQTRTPEGPEVS
jgi:4-carboxymuconolactone decarboxylase